MMIEFVIRLSGAAVVLFVLAAAMSGVLSAGREYAGRGDRLGLNVARGTVGILFLLGVVLTFAILVP